jgi:hypothetical protein
MIWLFIGLQTLDVLTTWTGLRLGLGEASPTVRLFLGWAHGPLAGLILSKSIAFGLLVALMTRKPSALRLVNVWYTVLVAWNLTLIGLQA